MSTECLLLGIGLLISLMGNVVQSHFISIYKNTMNIYKGQYEEILRRIKLKNLEPPKGE